MSSGRRIYTTLDGLRGLAALLVVLYHNPLLSGAFWPRHGWLAVDMFFMLSGLVVDRAYAARLASHMSAGRFMLVRFIRLWPIYALGCLAGLGFLLSLHVWRHDVTLMDIAATLPNLLFVPAFRWVDIGYLVPLNPPGWSLVFELLANLVYALVLPYLSIRKLIAIVVLAATGLAILVATGGTLELGAMQGEALGGLLRVTFAFFCGVLIARTSRADQSRDGALGPLVILAVLATALVLPVGVWGQWLVIVALFPALVAAGAYMEPNGDRTRRVLRVLGRLSYPVYVLQYPVGIVILTLPKLLSGPGVQLAGWATIAIFFLGCALVDRFYDGPLRDWMTRRAIAHRLLPLSRDQKADALIRPL